MREQAVDFLFSFATTLISLSEHGGFLDEDSELRVKKFFPSFNPDDFYKPAKNQAAGFLFLSFFSFSSFFFSFLSFCLFNNYFLLSKTDKPKASISFFVFFPFLFFLFFSFLCFLSSLFRCFFPFLFSNYSLLLTKKEQSITFVSFSFSFFSFLFSLFFFSV